MNTAPKSLDTVPRVVLGGLATAVVSRADLAQLMVSHCRAVQAAPRAVAPALVFSSNGQGLALAGRRPEFAAIMAKADLVHADGMSVVFASRMTRQPLPERVATTDFFHDAAEAAQKNGLKFFMLGASEEQNRAAVQAIRVKYPDLHIVGRHHGYFDPTDDKDVCELIRASHADVLWVALGKPRQEVWSVENQHRLEGVGWIKTCGGLYSFLAGDSSRAPRWMQTLGFEWAYRLWRDPKRLLLRYLTTNPYALYRLIVHSSASQ